MDNQEWKQQISAYVDGELSPEHAAAVEQLLAQDPQARAYLAELRKLSSSLHVVKDEELSPDSEKKIFSTIRKEGRTMTNPVWTRASIGALVVTIVMMILVGDVYMKRGFQGRFKSSGVEFSQTYAIPSRGKIVQYEPYYLNTAAGAIDKKGSTGNPLAALQVGQGRMKSAADDIHDQYAPVIAYARKEAGPVQTASFKMVTGSETKAVLSGKAKDSLGRTVQYEPYYLNTSTGTDMSAVRGGSFETAERAEYFSASSAPVAGYGRAAVPAGEWVYQPVQYVQYVPENAEEYNNINENRFLSVANEPLSTLSADVDTASYSNVRRYLSQHQMPPRDAVRTEEMINYFTYNYPEPWFGQAFSITTDLAACPWNPGHQLMRVGLKGRTPAGFTLPPSNLVFLIDVSGSMADANKLPLLKEGFKMMVRSLRPQDYVSIVVYAGNAGVVLEPTSGKDKGRIMAAIDSLHAEGSTAGYDGIQLAYQMARQNFIRNGNNRVILATDGDFNVGISDTAELTRMIEEKRAEGVFLTILGFGQNNLKDGRMVQLADKGNGTYSYIDSLSEAQKVLVDELGSTLFTIAKDVKIQVEFNPAVVQEYRLIGYEKRALAKEDFNNDRKDAGEIGAGHTVTALYEIVPTGYWSMFESHPGVDPLKYQRNAPVFKQVTTNDVATVKLRYKEPEGNASKLMTKTVKRSDLVRYPKGDFAWASAVAEFGMLLRGSEFRGSGSYDQVLGIARSNFGNDPNGLRAEFLSLVETARSLDPQPQPVIWQGEEDYQYSYPQERSEPIKFK